MKSSMYEGLFKALKKENVKACVVSSMRGAPIAWYGIERKKIDVFSALSAAMYGASTVLHKENGLPSPELVVSSSKDSFLIVKGIDSGTILAAVGEGNRDEMSKTMDKLIKEFRGVGL